MMRIDGIVFDLDGTLADTEPLHIDTWLSVLKHLGLSFEESWMHQWIGFSDRLIAEHVCTHYLKSFEVKNLQQMKQEAYRLRATTEIKLFDGVSFHLQELAALIPLGLATNSSREDVSAVFKATDLQRYLKAVVTADDVSMLKPHPEPFKTATSLLKINPTSCFALEDSPTGIASAKKAGLKVIGVENSHNADKLKEADLIFPDTPLALEYLLNAF
jgi:HAD superfamily hydrolase (TIGR01509 family)